jgi:hypothetical protein
MVSQNVVHAMVFAGLLCVFAGPILVLFAVPANPFPDNRPRRILVGLGFAGLEMSASFFASAVGVLPQSIFIPLAAAIVGFIGGALIPQLAGGE